MKKYFLVGVTLSKNAEITELLNRYQQGDYSAMDAVFSELYFMLKQIARKINQNGEQL